MIDKTVKIFSLLLILLVMSCAGYIDKIHRDIDREEQALAKKRKDRFEIYRRGKTQKRRSIASLPMTTEKTSRISPETKRRYMPHKYAKKRYRAEDLNDNDNDGSLWGNLPEEDHLFTYPEKRKIDDIIIINVLKDLKNEITMELKRAFPVMKFKKKTSKKKGKGKAAEAGDNNAQKEEGALSESRIHDKITAIISEKIGRNNYLIKGRKVVLFRNKKREIEVQALISKKDILDDNTVNSDKFLETSIAILR